MKVVILAAGMGVRLGQGEKPKSLTLLGNGKSILEFQLENIKEYVPLDNVSIVVGYQKEAVMHQFPNLDYVENPFYASENTAKSLLWGINNCDDNILWINGDVVFRKEVIQKVLDWGRTCMVVNKGNVGEEEVKYRTNAQGRILEVSKIVSEAEGEALGINYFSHSDLPLLRENLTRCNSVDYFERAIEACIAQGINVQAIVVGADECAEVDFPKDLERVNQMISCWK